MGKNKLRRFQENEDFSNVLQPAREELLKGHFNLRGAWEARYFKNANPITLELGCGKGEYTLALARRYPERNFIGIDIKGARLWRGAKTALEEAIPNAHFLRMPIELLDKAFDSGEVASIWIPFPDPQIKYRRRKHRLTHPDFLARYHRILKSEGIVHLKTDSEFLYGYTLGILQAQAHAVLYAHHDVYHSPQDLEVVTSVQTFYEEAYRKENKSISYLAFKLKFE